MGSEQKHSFLQITMPSAACLRVDTAETIPESIPDGVYLAAEIFSRDAEDILLSLEAALGPRLLVPEIWRNVLPTAGIMISSSLSGGILRQRLEDAERASPGRCWLRLERLRMRFSLPCPSGLGTALTQEELGRLLQNRPDFYAPEFCCRYCYDLPDGMVLFDTEETWAQKLMLAQSAGFSGVLIPSDG